MSVLVNYDKRRIKEKPEYIKKFTVEELKEYPEIFVETFKEEPSLLMYLPKEIRLMYPELSLDSVRRDLSLLRYLPMELRKQNPQICIKATEEDLNNIEFLPIELREQNEELCIKAVEHDPANIAYIPEEFQAQNSKVCLNAVRQAYHLIGYLTEELLEDNIEICMEAIDADYTLLSELPEALIVRHAEIFEKYIRETDEYIEEIPQRILEKNPDIYWINFLRNQDFSIENPSNRRIDILADWQREKLRGWFNLQEIPEEVLESYPMLYVEAIKLDYDKDTFISYKDLDALNYIAMEVLEGNPEICGEIIKVNPNLLPIEILKSDKVIDIILDVKPSVVANNWNFYGDIIIQKPEYLIKLMKNYPDSIYNFPKVVQNEYLEEVAEAFKQSGVEVAKKWGMWRIADGVQKLCPEMALKLVEQGQSIGYMADEVQELYSDRIVELVEQGQSLDNVSYNIKIKHPEMCKSAAERDINEFKYIPDEVLSREIEFCIEIIKKEPGYLKYLPKDVLVKIPQDIYMLVLKSDAKYIEYIPKEIQAKYPEICMLAIEDDTYYLRYIPQRVQVRYPEICINALQKDEDVYEKAFFYGRNLDEVKKIMYGEDVDRYNKLKQNNHLIGSRNYNERQMDIFYLKMIRTVGIDEVEELLKIPNLSREQIEKYSLNNDELFKELFETKYYVSGKDGIVLDIFRGFPVSQYKQYGKNAQFQIYKTLNESLDNEEEVSINELLKNSIIANGYEIDEKTLETIEKLSESIDKRVIDVSWSELESDIGDDLSQIAPAQRNAVKRIIEENIKYCRLKKGKVTFQDIIDVLTEDLVEEKHSQYIVGKKEYIIETVGDFFGIKENLDVLNISPVTVLKEFKENAGKGWIRNILNIPRSMTKEQFEVLQSSLDMKLDYESISEPKDENLEEVYKLLVEKEVPEIITYEKIELMFGGIQPPYSENFREFFIRNKEEILRNPQCYSNLAKIHNGFDKRIIPFLQIPVDELTVADVVDAHMGTDYIYKNVERGNEPLAVMAQRHKLSQEEFNAAQEIFNKAKAREETTIPPIQTEVHKRYRGRVLKTDDPLILFVGTITQCCQELGNAGEKAMVHSAIEKNGSVFVVEEMDDDGNSKGVVAQSWVWRNKDRMCFDSIELKNSLQGDKDISNEILAIYEEAGQRALARDEEWLQEQLHLENITQSEFDKWLLKSVTVGMQYTEESIVTIRDKRYKQSSIVLPAEDDELYEDGINGEDELYSDARDKQVVIAQISDKKRKAIKSRKLLESTSSSVKKHTPSKLKFYDGRGR